MDRRSRRPRPPPRPAARRRRQVRVVRRLPADPPRPGGRAARHHGALRDRRVRRGDLATGRPARSTSCSSRARSARRTRPRRSSGCAGQATTARDDRRLRDGRRDPGAPQLGRPRRLPQHGLPAARASSSRCARPAPVADYVAVDGELRGCPICRRQLLEFLTALVDRPPAAAARRGGVRSSASAAASPCIARRPGRSPAWAP